jgi:hypothetical protein
VSSGRDVAVAAGLVACEPWVLPVLALALLGWLEDDVGGVLAVFLPLAVALAAAAALGVAGFPGAPLAGPAALAAYALAAYGRRGLAALAFALFCAGALVAAGEGAGLALGGITGAALGIVVWWGALRVLPGGRLARRWRARRLDTRAKVA